MADEQSTTAEEPEEREAPELTPEEQEALERRREALARIRKFGDPVLKSKASPVGEFGGELDAEAERMVEIMRGAMGIGLAATQVGVMRRIVVFQVGPDAQARALVNPEIEWLSDDLITAEEGCLSLPRVTVDVERPLHARVSALDTSGERLLIEAAGLEARVLQHEIDHLDGVLMVDRTLREQRRAALKALRAGESFTPEMLTEPDPEAVPEEGESPASATPSASTIAGRGDGEREPA